MSDASVALNPAGNLLVDLASGVVEITQDPTAAVGVISDPGATRPAVPSNLILGLPANLIVGQNATVTATVSAAPPPQSNAPVPSGTVDFYADGTWLGNEPVDASGEASIQIPDVAVGSQQISADYNGDSNYFPSTDSGTLTVDPGDTTTTLALAQPNTPTTYGTTVTLTATVALVDPASGTPTGMVNFLAGTTLIDSEPLNAGDVATAIIKNLPAGDDKITAVYVGCGRIFWQLHSQQETELRTFSTLSARFGCKIPRFPRFSASKRARKICRTLYVGNGNFNSSASTAQDHVVNAATLTITTKNVTMTYADGTTLDATADFTSVGLECGETIAP